MHAGPSCSRSWVTKACRLSYVIIPLISKRPRSRTIVLDLGRQTKQLKITNPCLENFKDVLPYLDKCMLLGNGDFILSFILYHEVKASKRCASVN